MKILKKTLNFCFILLLCATYSSCTSSKSISVKSPDGKITLELKIGKDSMLYYKVESDGKEIILPSRFGIVTDNTDLGERTAFSKSSIKEVNETYNISGVHSMAFNHYNELTLNLITGTEEWILEARAYDDGAALRCKLNAKQGRKIQKEVTEWKLSPGSYIWYQNELGSYEGTFSKAMIDTLPSNKLVGLPVTVELPAGKFAMLSEASLVNYSDLALKSTDNKSFTAFFHAEKDGWITDEEVVQPWRLTIITKDLNALVNSDMIRNLNPAPAPELADASWIRPGRAGWNWWSTPSLIYNEQHKWVDWTKQLGFEYYLIDAGWNKWEDGKKNAWDCVTEVANYAKSQNTGIWIWVHSREVSKDSTRKAFFENAVKAGVAGIKIDFIPKCTHEWSNWYESTLREAASFKLMIDFHGPVKPTGRERTWPNELTREAVRGHEWHITRYKRTLLPDHDCIVPFNRFVQGAADYTPTVFNPDELRGYTWPREIAQAIVFTSPFLCFADHPENYLNSPCADLIKSIPSTWDETIVLPGSEIGKCAAFARRKGNDWFIGVINGSEKKDLSISMNFLPEGSYSVSKYEDQEGKNDAVVFGTGQISRNDLITLSIRPAGGFVARITKN